MKPNFENSSKKIISINSGPQMKWFGLLGVLFVILKVFGVSDVATWSWWLVLLPFYLSLAITLGIIVLLVLVAIFAFLIAGFLDLYIHYHDKFTRYRNSPDAHKWLKKDKNK